MALAQAREIDAILVTELSRWGRSTQDLVQTLDDLHSWKVGVLAHTGLSFDLGTSRGRLMRTIEAETAQRGRAPTIPELAESVGVPEDEVVEALQTYEAYSTRSLSQPLGRFGEEETMQDVLGGEDAGFGEVEDSALVEAGLDALDERERRIVELRFFDGLTQSEIAAHIGISQMHVSRLLRRALHMMRGRLEDTMQENVR